MGEVTAVECSLGTGWNSPGEGNSVSKDPEAWASLAGQWSRLCTSNAAESRVLPLVGELSSCMLWVWPK